MTRSGLRWAWSSSLEPPGHKQSKMAPSVVGFVTGVGWVLDPNSDLRTDATQPAFVPRKAWHLSDPHIKPLVPVPTEEASRASTRERKRRRKWEQHPDATEAELVDKLRSAHAALLGVVTCQSFFGSDRVCCAIEPLSAEAVPSPAARLGSSALCVQGAVNPSGHQHPLLLDPAAVTDTHEFNESDQDVLIQQERLTVVAKGSAHVRCSLAGEAYLLPPGCAFFLGDVWRGLNSLVQQQKLFKMVVLDPPWPSKSRGKHYCSMPTSTLGALPVGRLLRRDGLLAMWVTNDRKLVHAAQGELLESWGLEYVSTWYWLKVTCRGELCSPLESPHKKPFERLILARRPQQLSQSPCCVETRPAVEIPQGQVLITQPAQHSRKPFVGDILKPFAGAALDDMTHDLTRDSDLLKPRAGAGHGAKAITPHDMPPLASSSFDTGHRADACAATARRQPMEESLKDGLGGECLEIFARELRDGWTAVGDECILFQHLVHMQPVLRPRENCVSKSHA